MKTNNFTFSILPFSPSRFTLHASPFFPAAGRQEFPVDTCNPFMQNEPNFQCSRQTLTLVITETYNERALPDMTKTNPIEPKANPIRTQNEPNFMAAHCENLYFPKLSRC